MVFICTVKKRFKVNNGTFGIEQYKTKFETELWANDEHVIVKMYTLLPKSEMKTG